MSVAELSGWLNVAAGPVYVWYVKRLSGNDTLANESHQAGPYIPKEFLFRVLPVLNRPEVRNPDVWLDLYVDSHAAQRKVRAIWYNNKLHDNPKGGRNEARLTNFGGTTSALLDPESTGALTVFAFRLDEQRVATECHVWICRDEAEEALIEERVGPVEPGRWTIWSTGQPSIPSVFSLVSKTRANCWLESHEIPEVWRSKFPAGEDVIRKTVELRPATGLGPDGRLVKRRDCEFEIFRSVEEAVELQAIKQGFESVDEFTARAQTILQRRKARSGRSLELHAREVFREEGLREGSEFEHQPESEPGKRPDFLFPSADRYRDPDFPQSRLRMLAVKTTCKDRWRQILNEAARIRRKHLLTLQEGISEGQFQEMTEAEVQLVVPAPLIARYPRDIQPHLQSLERFIAEVRGLGH